MNINRAQLEAYLDDALSDQETAEVENNLRDKESLRLLLRSIIQERDRGDHSICAIWRRERLSCPSREHLGSFLLQALETGHQEYIEFHLKVVCCSYCLANLADLKTQHVEEPQVQQRRKRYFESSAGLLKA